MANDKIRNVGPKSAAWLRQVGVRTLEDLRRTGPIETYLKVKRAGFRPSLNLLYAMQGALEDRHWAELSEETKQSLVLAADAAENVNPIKSRWDKAAARSAERDGKSGEAEPPVNDAGDNGGSGNQDENGSGDGDPEEPEITGMSRDFD